jgi:hypothetical protein
MVVMLVSILLFSVIKFDSLLFNFLVRIALIPVVAGISYEIIRLSAKRETGTVFKDITAARALAAERDYERAGRFSIGSSDHGFERGGLKLEPQSAERRWRRCRSPGAQASGLH